MQLYRFVLLYDTLAIELPDTVTKKYDDAHAYSSSSVKSWPTIRKIFWALMHACTRKSRFQCA